MKPLTLERLIILTKTELGRKFWDGETGLQIAMAVWRQAQVPGQAIPKLRVPSLVAQDLDDLADSLRILAKLIREGAR
jgi:hypothetical protein